jgi:hypothetical protein
LSYAILRFEFAGMMKDYFMQEYTLDDENQIIETQFYRYNINTKSLLYVAKYTYDDKRCPASIFPGPDNSWGSPSRVHNVLSAQLTDYSYTPALESKIGYSYQYSADGYPVQRNVILNDGGSLIPGIDDTDLREYFYK